MKTTCLALSLLISLILSSQEKTVVDTLKIRKNDSSPLYAPETGPGSLDTTEFEIVNKNDTSRILKLTFSRSQFYVLDKRGKSAEYQVFSYDIKISYVIITNYGSRISKDISDILRKMKPGETTTIENIIVKNKNGRKFNKIVVPLKIRKK